MCSSDLSYSVAQRTNEIGIRMAIGAHRRQLMGMMLADGLEPVLFGLAGGLLLSFMLMPLLAGLLFRVASRDPANYVAVFAVVLLVSAFAAFVPARRAINADPLTALRYE